MKIVKEKGINLKEVLNILQNDGLIVYPTETLYGVGVNAMSESAVKKLSLYKRRPAGKPYSVAVSDISMAKKYAFLNRGAIKIYKTFLPGPLTVISKGKHKLAPGIESESGTLGIRIPNYKLIIKLINNFKKPITATSANASYKKRPYKIPDILNNLSDSQKKLIDLIIDAGTLPHNEPSTVVDTTREDLTILRQGNISLKNKNEILSRSEEETKNTAKELWQKYERYFASRAIIFALIGDLGSGKTIFTKGLAKALGITDVVTSPSFNLVNKYKIKNSTIKLTHVDVWRLANINEIADLNISKDITDKSVISIEWADKISDFIRKHNEDAVIIWVKIIIPKNSNENERVINWGVSK